MLKIINQKILKHHFNQKILKHHINQKVLKHINKAMQKTIKLKT